MFSGSTHVVVDVLCYIRYSNMKFAGHRSSVYPSSSGVGGGEVGLHVQLHTK